MRKQTHKYGIEIPRSIKEAIRIDQENGNIMWVESLNKEMSGVSVAFEILELGEKAPPGWTKSSGT